MSDIDLYDKSAQDYESLQERRPDYVGARNTFLELALEYLKDKRDISVVDFCSGTGNNSLLLSQNLSIGKVALIDINKEFLDIALKSGIKAKEIVRIKMDVLETDLRPEYDVVISMFAYHHVLNVDKRKYVEQVKKALRPEGIVLLGEIYSPDKETALKYYEYLLDSISKDERTAELENFLKQTANSDHFEYKVARKFAHDQFAMNGFKSITSRKVWPLENSPFDPEVGTFVEVWQI